MSSVTLKALADFPAQLESHFTLFAEDQRNWAPPFWDGIPSESLTALEQVCHIRDIEEAYQLRFRRTLTENNPFLVSIDTEALAREREYARDDPGQALADFRRARTQTLEILAGLQPGQLTRPAVFEGYGPVTLGGLVHYLCSHDQQHLAGLQWLLGRIAAVEPESG